MKGIKRSTLGFATVRRGVTLLEITLAVGIIVPVLSTVFMFYAQSLRNGEESSAKTRQIQLARVVLDRIATELRQSTGFSNGYGTGIYGTRHQISINTVVIPEKAMVERRGVRDKRRPGQFDLRQIDYYVAWDETNLDENADPRALGMVRRERRTFNELKPSEIPAEGDVHGSDAGPGGATGPGGAGRGGTNEDETGAVDRDASGSVEPLEGGMDVKDGGGGLMKDDAFDESPDEELEEEELEGAKRELYAPEIKYIEFLYHDGHRWWETWEIAVGNALPQMVMVTIGYEPEPPEENKIEIIENILENEDDVKPLAADRFMTIVRIPQADTFFGSRIQREAKSFMDSMEEVE